MKGTRWAWIAVMGAVMALVVPAVGQGKANGASLKWSRSRGGQSIGSYGFGTVDGGSHVTRWFRLGSSRSTKVGPLAVSLAGSSAFSIASDGCSTKSISEKLSCWVGVNYVSVGDEGPQYATLTATPKHGAAASLGLSGTSTGPSPGTSSWGSAVAVPGAAALNVAGDAVVSSVSCSSAGECAAGGSYATGVDAYSAFTLQAFVVSEEGGVWGTAIVPPGLEALNTGDYATVSSVSCAGAGYCAAGGSYVDDQEHGHAFVVSEQGGVWGTAIEVTEALKGGSSVSSVSCVSPGNCTSGGYVGRHAFVVSEKNGTWGKALVLVGPGRHDNAGATVTSVSCAGVGDCVAGGYSATVSKTGRYSEHAFVADERNGVWGRRRILVSSGDAEVTSVSCSVSGNCAAVGYVGGPGGYAGFVADEKNGAWGNAMGVYGAGTFTFVWSVSCVSPGNCVAGVQAGQGGDKYGDGYNSQAYLVSEENGKWGNPFVPAGLPPGDPYLGPYAATASVSCGSPGNCAATGYDEDGAFVVAERDGVWGTAGEVPGTATLGTYSWGSSVSCAWAGNCAIGGSYDDDSGHAQAFVTAP